MVECSDAERTGVKLEKTQKGTEQAAQEDQSDF